jgi:hypothetical protein
MSYGIDTPTTGPDPLAVSKRPSRKLSRLAPLAVGGLLVVGGGVFALTALQGDGGSPEAPVESLFKALDDEDVIGMLESLTAPERDALIDPTERLAGELRRIGVADERLDLGDLQGFDFQVTDLELEVDEVADDLAEVRVVGGQITTTISPDQLPIGADLRRSLEDAGVDLAAGAQTEVSDLAGNEDPFVVVRRDGRWGFSIGYTVAESARRDAGAARPEYGSSPIATQGAESPEGAVEGMLEAVDEGDIRALIGHLDPEEMAPLYDYAPLFLPDVEAQADLPAMASQLTIDEVEATSEGEGDSRRVTLTALRAEFAPEGGDPMVVRFADGCWEVGSEAPGGPGLQRQCVGEATGEIPAFLEGLIDTSALVELTTGIEVHEVDGDWYVSPTRTVLGALVGVAGILSDDAIPGLVALVANGGFLGDN